MVRIQRQEFIHRKGELTMFDNLTSTGIVAEAGQFASMFEAPVLVAVGLGVAITLAYAIKNMF